MNRRCFLVATTGLMCHAASAQMQPGLEPGPAFQFFTPSGAPLSQTAMPVLRAEAGKPFSATATTQTSQILTDGTHVNQTTAMMEYRDAEGRVRTEEAQSSFPGGQVRLTITIRDPVAGVSYTLDPARKSAVKTTTVAASAVGGSGRGGRGGRGGSGAFSGSGGRFAIGGLPPNTAQTSAILPQVFSQVPPGMENVPFIGAGRNNIVEDLGTMTVNGVLARGTRTTTIVPAGAIGNDREFHSVSERWFSSDLNLLVKSVNTDPRFGTTTYELTNISRLPPDSSLFQVPAEYTVVSR